MPDLRAIAQDSDFKKLPLQEQMKAFAEYDKDFAALSPEEQIKGIIEMVNGITEVKKNVSAPIPDESFFGSLKRGATLAGTGMYQGIVEGGQSIRERLGMEQPNVETIKQLQGFVGEQRQGGGTSWIAKAGELAGGILPYLSMPGGAFKRIVERLLASGIQGGTIGALQPTSEGESRVSNAAVGAGTGVVGQGILSTLGKGINAITGQVVPGTVRRLGEQYKIPTTLGEETKKPFTQWVESVQEKIPWLGIGKFRARQNESAQQAAKTYLANYAKGANPVDSMAENRSFTNGLFEDMKALLPGIEKQQIQPNSIKPIATAFLKRYPDLFKRFQDTETEGLLQNIVAGVKDVTKSTPASTILGPTGKPMIEASTQTMPKTLTFDEAWTLRQGLGEKIGQARKMFQRGEIDQTAYGQLKTMFAAISGDMERWAGKIGKPEINDAFKASNDAYKNYVAKYDILQRAYEKAAGPNEEVGRMFSPMKFSNALTQIIQKDKSYKLFTQREISEMSGIANIMQVVRRAGQYMENPPTGQRLTLPILGAAAENVAYMALGAKSAAATGGVAVVGTVIAKILTTTKLGKNIAMAASKIEPSSPAMKAIIDEIYELVPRAVAVAATHAEPRKTFGKEEE